jgi:hypothetical protein
MYTIASFLEIIPGMFLLWAMHITPAAILYGLAWLIKKNSPLPWYELLLMTVGPFILWALLITFGGTGKSLSNLAECLILGLIITPLLLARILIGQRQSLTTVIALLHIAAYITAFSLWFFVPGLPE